MRRFALWMVVAFSLLVINIIMQEYMGDFYDQMTDALLVVILTDRFIDWILNDGRKEDEHD